MSDIPTTVDTLPIACPEPASRAVSALLLAAALAIIGLGIGLRIVQLPSRVLFFDEAYTQIRVAGYTIDDVNHAIFDGRPHRATTVRAYARVGPHASPARTVASLAAEDPQHPPLFYLGELATVRALGDARWAWRALPALIGIAAIGAMWLLARELFDPRGALAAAALFAVSPVERIYSEQAREYSLVTLMTLLMTLALVRACRTRSRAHWALYAASAALGLYTSPFLGYVVGAHAVAVAGLAYSGRKKVLGGFSVAVVVALLVATPWLVQIMAHRDVIAAGTIMTRGRWPLAQLAIKWCLNVGTTFFDLECLDAAWLPMLAVVLLVGLWTAVMGLRRASPEARWIVGTLIVVPALLLVLPDVVLGQHYSVIARYGLTVYTGLLLAVAAGIATRPVPAFIMLGAGIAASVIGTQHAAWWDNGLDANEPAIAALVNAAPAAEVVSPTDPGFAITFARLFDNDVRMSLRHDDLAVALADPHDPVFVVNATGPQLAAFSRATRIPFESVDYPHAQATHLIGRSDDVLAFVDTALAELRRVGVNVRAPVSKKSLLAGNTDHSDIVSLDRSALR